MGGGGRAGCIDNPKSASNAQRHFLKKRAYIHAASFEIFFTGTQKLTECSFSRAAQCCSLLAC